MTSSQKSLNRNFETAGILLLALYILAGVIYSALLPPVTRFLDEQEYLSLSHNLLHGPGYSMDGMHLTAARPPGYPLFLFALEAMGGGFFGIRTVQFLLLGATIILVSRLGSGGKSFAGLLIVTGLVICYPVLFYTGGALYAQTFASFLFILATTLVLAAPSRGLGLNLGTGFTFGALILAVPTFLMTMPVMLGIAWGLKMIRLRDVLIVVLSASLVVGVWTIRNAVCLHHFVPVASNSGLNFLIGNNENSVAYEGAAYKGMIPYYREVDQRGLDEFQMNSFYWHTALAYIHEHPFRAFVQYLERTLNFFNVTNNYAAQNEAEFSFWKQIVMAASYLLLLGLLVWRVTEIKRFPLLPREKLLLAVYILSAFTSAIFLTRIRLRLPYDYLIIAVIALHLSRRLEAAIGSRRPSPSPRP